MSLTSGTAWLVGGRLANDVLSFVLFILLARRFGPDGIGVYSFSFAIATILYQFVMMGIEEYGVREHARSATGQRRDLVGRLLGAQFALASAAILVVAVLLATRLIQGSHGLLLSFMVFYQLCCAASHTLFIPLFASGRVALTVSGEMLSRIGVLLVAAVLMVLGSHDMTAVLVGYPLFGIALVALAAFWSRRSGSSVLPRMSGRELVAILRELWSFAAANLFFIVSSRLGVLLLFLLVGSTEAGIYSGAFKFAEVAWMVLGTVPWAAYARLNAMYRADPGGFASLSCGVLRGTLLLSGLMAWGMYWVLPSVVVAFLGERFQGTESALRGLAGVVLLVGFCSYLLLMLLVAGGQVMRMRVAALQFAVVLIASLLLIPPLGILGAVAALFIALVVSAAVTTRALISHGGFREVPRQFGVFVLCITGSLLAGWASGLYAPVPWVAPLVSLIVLLSAARLAGLLDLKQWTGALY